MFSIDYQKHLLHFRFEAGTSRGVLTERPTYLVHLRHSQDAERVGIGEAAPLAGLSTDDFPDFEQRLAAFCHQFNQKKVQDFALSEWAEALADLPSLIFALETAYADWQNGGQRKIFDNDFFQGKPLPINGLIWMGSRDFMQAQVEEKIRAGFQCLKMKIGAIDFEEEMAILTALRRAFSAERLTLRVDANGAFNPSEALAYLERLAEQQLHSIEQPIRAGQEQAIAELCRLSPLPIALDEELIGRRTLQAKERLLDQIRPSYIILKPTLLGGFGQTKEWIRLAEERAIGWWITSALESNIGLNAICQFTAEYAPTLPQGLGTGQLYHNNIPMPLSVEKGYIRYLTQENKAVKNL